MPTMAAIRLLRSSRALGHRHSLSLGRTKRPRTSFAPWYAQYYLNPSTATVSGKFVRLPGPRALNCRQFSSSSPRSWSSILWSEVAFFAKYLGGGTAILGFFATLSGFILEGSVTSSLPDPPGLIVELTAGEGAASSNTSDFGNKVKVHCQISSEDTEEEKDFGAASRITVVLDGDVGQTSFDFARLQRELSSSGLRVVSFDRPGLGLSSPSPKKRTSRQIVQEMSALLQALGIAGPVILVGAGFGGVNQRLFAADIAEGSVPGVRLGGLVLIDTPPDDMRTRDRNISKEVAQLMDKMKKNADAAVTVARFRLSRVLHFIKGEAFLESKFERWCWPFVLAFAPSVQHRRTIAEELRYIEEGEEEAKAVAGPLAAALTAECLRVIAREGQFEQLKRAGLSNDEVEQMEKIWREGQKELAGSPEQLVWFAKSPLQPHIDKPKDVAGIVCSIAKHEGCI